MLLDLIVVDEDLAVLAVAAGFLLGGLDDSEDVLGLGEDGVHLLKRTVGRLGVEEVDDGEDECVARIGFFISEG